MKFHPPCLLVPSLRALWVGALGLLLTFLWGAGSAAALVVEPPGLAPGDPYRLVFVTSQTHDATSKNPADYDAFVTSVANAIPDLAALGTQWRVIGSIELVPGPGRVVVDAHDHTDSAPENGGVPFYRLDGLLVANDNTELWGAGATSPTLVNSVSIDELGQTYTSFVFTGSYGGGTADSVAIGDEGLKVDGTPRPAGANSTVGLAGVTTQSWMRASLRDTDNLMPFYAMSDVLIATGVPEPGTSLLLGSALAVLALVRARRP
ncbi:MAG: PEP-CTERM sorting domain-containing protein [bacterium]|nr:PEP-CTERM sorting domain-containing protein [bacterium]